MVFNPRSAIFLVAFMTLLSSSFAGRTSAHRRSLSLSHTVRVPKKECTLNYIGNGAGCICYLLNEAGSYPKEMEPYCKAAYKNPKSLRPKCDGYVIKGKISQENVEETLMWSVENCLSTPATPATRLLSGSAPVSVDDLPLNLPTPSEHFFFLPALLPIIGKVALKGAIFAGKRLVGRAVVNLAVRRTAAQAAKKAIGKGVKGFLRSLFKRRARKAAQRKFNAAERLRKAADAAAKAARRRSAEIAKKVQQAEKAARDAAKRVVQKAKQQTRKLVREAKKFAHKEARAVADCVRERVEALKTGEDVLVEVDAGTVREEAETCLKESKVICVGLVSAEAVRGEANPESLSFFADIATCLSDNEGVCVAALTAKFVEQEVSEGEYLAGMIDCFPEGDSCGPQIAKLVIGGDLTAETAVEQAIACDNEQKEKEEEQAENKNDKPKRT